MDQTRLTTGSAVLTMDDTHRAGHAEITGPLPPAGELPGKDPFGSSKVRLSELEPWLQHLSGVLARPERPRRSPAIAVLTLMERERVESRFGRRGIGMVLANVAQVAITELDDHERIALDGHGRLVFYLRGAADWQIQRRLVALTTRLARVRVSLGEEHLHITPVCGWTSLADTPVSADPYELLHRAVAAADVAGRQLDLVPRRWTNGGPREGRSSVLPAPVRTGLQGLATVLLGVGIPFAALVLLHGAGIDVSKPVYIGVTVALVITAVTIWVEGFYALDPERPPANPAAPYPRASAVIPAYLPNEAATIVDTLRAFLGQDYPGELGVILAYNTPQPLPVEDELRELAAADPRLVVLNVPFSESKAQNVNAALQVVDGEFVGIFDADHHPAPDAFRRAWRWISHGADVVQGHCVIRNGDASWVSRTVAVEFESIYAVSHPGRTKLHGFGIFGGSNGFWRTSALREIRMRAEMLTEDIDSSMRVLLSGRKVVNDPALLSTELAPATVGALWHQRIRWAQGWFQVSRRHLGRALRSKDLTVRNKLGVGFLLGWREIYPWLSLQVFPVIAFMAWRQGGVTELDWIIPTFLLTSLYTMSVGPGQVFFAWRLAAPEIRRHRWWFVSYLFLASILYAEFKNVIARVAQLKDLAGERRWVVTPRQVPAPVPATRAEHPVSEPA